MDIRLQINCNELVFLVSKKSSKINDALETIRDDKNPIFWSGFVSIPINTKLAKDILKFERNSTISKRLERYILLDIIFDNMRFMYDRKTHSNNDNQGYIYILKSLGLYKIGRTINPESRMKKYRTENPHITENLLMIKVIDCVKAEKELLEEFKGKIKKGDEWFSLDKNDIKKAKIILKKYEKN